jgi:hypothetical protein
MKNLQFKAFSQVIANVVLTVSVFLFAYSLSSLTAHAANMCLIADCVNVDGWAQDLDVPNTAVDVEIYRDGPVGTGSLVSRITADQPYAGYANHGFSFSIPSSLKTGNPIALYIYSIGKNKTGGDDGDNAFIGTKVIQCGAVVPTYQCSDSIDNDGDGKIDYPADPGCLSATDDNETDTATSFVPEGFLDTANCDRFNGWAVDRDVPLTAIRVDLYADGGGFGTFLGSIVANDSRPDVGAYFRTMPVPGIEVGDNHGYWFVTPNSVKDSNPHAIYAYGINNDGSGSNPMLIGAPQNILCSPPIVAPLPTVSITATPSSIASGGSSVLNWSSTNSVSCTASVGWSGSKTISGSSTVSPAVTTTYTLTCLNSSGASDSQSAIVTVAGGPSTTQCSDGIDNDGDGKIDYPADPGCVDSNDDDETNGGGGPSTFQCSDLVDNDGDGAIDFPADIGCSSANDNDETNGGGPISTGFTLDGNSVVPIKFIGLAGADSGVINLSVNPAGSFSAPTSIQVVSIVSKNTGSPLPTGVIPSYSFAGKAFIPNPTEVMSLSGSGQYINEAGAIGLAVKVRLSKKISERYVITFKATGGGNEDTHSVTLDPSLNPDFREI